MTEPKEVSDMARPELLRETSRGSATPPASSHRPLRLAVFASGHGTNFAAIWQQYQAGQLPALKPILLITDRACEAEALAEQFGLPHERFLRRDYPSEAARERAMLERLQAFQVDLIALAGYMRMVGQTLLNAYPQRILNLHPALLPLYPGTEAILRAYQDGVPYSGVTVHYIDAGMDTGPVLAQEKVARPSGISLREFEARIHAAEHRLFPATLEKVAENIQKRKGAPMQHFALLSMFKKEGLIPLAQGLLAHNLSLLSTGGTARALREAGLPVTEVQALTHFPEMMDGRVKTLHPAIHGGILARRDREDDLSRLAENDFGLIDVVACNLYPFAEVLAKGVSDAEQIEMIDIGGPSMLRAAAKNHRWVTVLVDPADYDAALASLDTAESMEARALRRHLAAKVFQETARYDALVAAYLESPADFAEAGKEDQAAAFPAVVQFTGRQIQSLRYGENPHQKASFYALSESSEWSLSRAVQLHGKELSYNNIQDTNAALELLAEFSRPTVVVLKHMNPCGLGSDDDLYTAWRKAYESDPVSIFGGIIACNREVTKEIADELHKLFLEIVIAPSFTPEAEAVLAARKNIRLLTLPMRGPLARNTHKVVSVIDGFLLQERDLAREKREDCRLMTEKAPDEALWSDLLEANLVVKHCKSNAIVVYKDGATLGIGVGQSNRVGAAKLALEQAGEKARGAVLASDAFFPMPDTVDLAADFGISAIIQPGGSLRDQDSIDVCNARGIAMVASGVRHFKH